MNHSRRKALRAGGGASVLALLVAAGIVRPGEALAQQWNQAAFEVKSLPEALRVLGAQAVAASDAIQIRAPEIAENGAVVPIGVESRLPGTQSITLLIEKNPQAVKAVIKAMMVAQSQAESDIDAALKDTVGTYYKTTMEAAKLAASKQPIMIDQRKNTQFILDRGQSMKELGYVKKLAPRAAIDWTLLGQVIAENKALYAGLKLKTVA